MKETLNKSVIFTNGTIYIDSKHKVKNLLVQEGIVTAFDVDPAKYPNAQIVDLKGGTAYPGFMDSHVHLVEVGFCSDGISLKGCTNVRA